MADYYYKEVGKDNDIVSVVMSGKLDASQCDYLLHSVQKQIELGHKKLILDCTDLEYISSVGLGMLVRIHSRMNKHGGDVKLAHVQGLVAEVMKIARLDRLVEMYPTVDDAIEAHGG